MKEHQQKEDPLIKLKESLTYRGLSNEALQAIDDDAKAVINKCLQMPLPSDPSPEDLFTHEFAPTSIHDEQGASASQAEEKVMRIVHY